MATPMIEQFPKGKLNKCWHYIDLCKYVHPELTGTIDRMRDMLIRYTLIKPWMRAEVTMAAPNFRNTGRTN